MPKSNSLKKDYKVTKSNILNEMRANNMTLQELRLFSVYLSRINPQDISTRQVRFTIEEFRALMELGRMNIVYCKKVAESLLSKIVFVPTERGGFTGWTLFSEFKVDSDDDGEWYVRIDANEKALPLLFEFKSHYFKYELWNALHLRGKNHLRMYEVLKQYENIGYRIISLESLRHWLGIEDHEYSEFKYFKRDVLEPCKKALAENTDISFTYEPHRKKGRKIAELIFRITRNADHKDPLALREFIELNPSNIPAPTDLDEIESDDTIVYLEQGKIGKRDEILIFLRDAVERTFNIKQMLVLYDIVIQNLPHLRDNKLYLHFQAKYNYMLEQDSRKPIRSKFGYMKKIIGSI